MVPPWDFPDGSEVKNLPFKAGNVGSIPGRNKIPHVMGQLSPPRHYWAHTPQLESPRNAMKDGVSHDKDPMCLNWDPTQPSKLIN